MKKLQHVRRPAYGFFSIFTCFGFSGQRITIYDFYHSQYFDNECFDWLVFLAV